MLGARDPLGETLAPLGVQGRREAQGAAPELESRRHEERSHPSFETSHKVWRESRQVPRRGRQAGNRAPGSSGKGVAAGGRRKLLAQGHGAHSSSAL